METVLRNYNGKGDDLRPKLLEEFPKEEYFYVDSDLEHFDKVFQKDTLPTYHMMMDNMLHWVWNEYGNDPEKFNSHEYHTSILDKVFAFVNARILGIINPADNHAEIIECLCKCFGDGDLFVRAVRKRYNELYDRETEFTKEDALVWYKLMEPLPVMGYQPKPVVVPYFYNGNEDSVNLINNQIEDIPFVDFYKKVFRYTITYYEYMYAAKFRPVFEKISPDKGIFISSDKNIRQIYAESNFHHVGQLPDVFPELIPGGTLTAYVASRDGNLYDSMMYSYCEATIVRTISDEWYITADRGVDLFERDNYNRLVTKWLNTLVNKSKGTEQLRSEQWRDIMQCNAVLFWDGEQNTTILFRITNASKYHNRVYFATGIQIAFDKDDVGYLTLSTKKLVSILSSFWEIFDHTLDLWVRYTDNGENQWSLISNIYAHKSNYYLENPHITYFPMEGGPILEPNLSVIGVVPRDGIDWSYGNRKFTYIPQPINGYIERKPYLG